MSPSSSLVRTRAFQALGRGSNPLGDTNQKAGKHWLFDWSNSNGDVAVEEHPVHHGKYLRIGASANPLGDIFLFRFF